jgi:hypothetical protein
MDGYSFNEWTCFLRMAVLIVIVAWLNGCTRNISQIAIQTIKLYRCWSLTRETGTFKPIYLDWKRAVWQLIWRSVLGYADRNACVGTRQVGDGVNALHMTLWRVLHELVLYSYHLRPQVSCLLISEGTRTSVGVLFTEALSISLLTSVLFTYEACFRRDGINIYKQHQSAEENPHDVIHSRHWQQFSISVGRDCWWLVGPPFATRFTGNHYCDFLLHDLHHIGIQRDTCMMVLWYILVALCEIASIKTIMTNR